MTNDTKAPARLWASYIRTQDGMWIGKHAAQDAPYKGATAYIRHDLHLSLVAKSLTKLNADRIEELETEVDYLRRWQNAAFWANPNIDIDIDKCPEAQEELRGGVDEWR